MKFISGAVADAARGRQASRTGAFAAAAAGGIAVALGVYRLLRRGARPD